MDSFQKLIQRIVLVAITLLVITLLLLIPVMTLVALALAAAAALVVLSHTAVQVAQCTDRELDLAWPGYLSSPSRGSSSPGPDDPDGGDSYHVAEDVAADEERSAEKPDSTEHARWVSWIQRFNEKAIGWQPETEPTYRQYLLGQAWMDLAATMTEGWGRFFLLIFKARTQSDRRLTGKKRSSVFFPVRWSISLAIGAAFLATALVTIAVLGICGLALTVGVLAWLSAAAALRATEAAVAWVRKITMSCQVCHRQLVLPSYECGKCDARHRRLVPNHFGALWHPCHCGTSVATTVLLGKWRLKAYCSDPACDSRLPPGIGRIPIQYIPILGARQAGKSTLSCLMLRDLVRELDGRGGSLEFEDSRDAERLGLAKDCRSISKTRQEAGLRPVLITIKDRGDPRQLLYFFDPAGEDIDQSDSLGKHAFVSNMSAFAVTIDPLTIPAVAAQLHPAASPGDAPNTPTSPDVLEALTGTLQELNESAARPDQRGRGHRIKRIAVVVTKVDRLPGDQQDLVLNHCDQWLADVGMGNQLKTLSGMADHVEYVTSGLSKTCSYTDYASLALWISGLESQPPDHTSNADRRAGQVDAPGPVSLGLPLSAAASAHPEPEAKASPTDEAPTGRQLLPASYRRGRIGLLGLAVAATAFSWFAILDVLVRGVLDIFH